MSTERKTNVEIPKKLISIIRKIGLIIQGRENMVTQQAVRDDGRKCLLGVTATDIGDIGIYTFHCWGLRFRNGIGGTVSENTWNALRFLHVAMHLDNDNVKFDNGSLKCISPDSGNLYVARNLLMSELQDFDLTSLFENSNGQIERMHDDRDGSQDQNLVIRFVDPYTLAVCAYDQSMSNIIQEEETSPEFIVRFEKHPWTFMAVKLLAVAMYMDCVHNR